MKVLFATDRFYLPQGYGGSESSAHDLCSWFQRRSVAVGVLAGLDPKGRIWLRNRVIYKIRPSHSFPMDRVMGYPVFRGWHPVEGVSEVTSRFEPDIAIIQARQPIKLAERFLQRRIPCVVYVRGLDFDKWQEQVTKRHLALCFVANSEFTAGEFRKQFGIEPTVIPPLVRPEAYRTISARNRVVFVNPHPLKGVDIAFKLAESRPDVAFEFVESWGLEGDLRNNFRTRAKSLGNISWRKPVLDMRCVYRNARIVLVPSQIEEAWGRVVTEAHVSGIPVLASNRGGLPESVGPGGILVDPESDISEWEKAFSCLWDDPKAYDDFSAAAFEYSMRTEIQPDHLIMKLISLISTHLKRVT